MRVRIPALMQRLLLTTKFWKNNRLILREFRHFPGVIVLSILFPLAAALLEGAGIGFLLAFLQNLVSADAAPLQTGVAWFDTGVLGVHTSKLEQLYRISALILLSTWLRAVFNYLTAIYGELAKFYLTDRLYKTAFEQLQSLSLSFFNQSKTGELINTLTTELYQLQQIMGGISFLLIKVSVLLIYVVIAFWISWQLFTLAIVLFGLIFLLLSKLNDRIREASFPISEARANVSASAIEFLNGIRTVQTFATQDFERRRFYQASADLVKAGENASKAMAAGRPIGEALGSSVLIGMIVLGMAVFVASGALQVSMLMAFLFLLLRLTPAVQDITGCLATMSSLQGSIHNIEKLLTPDDKPYLQNGSRRFTGLRRSIELRAVEFGYEPESLVLKNITLTIPKGQTIALVGSSGAGKSTLADLLPRFYDPTSGQILIDGTDLREFDVHTMRRNMAVVSQDTFIFNTSIRNNIAYGLDQVSDTAVAEAAQLANALEFIQEMPQGFETVLGDRGVRLSGGQRQRIAIARALLRNPEILILDEATSALDSVSERLIQESLEKLAVGRTVIAIAHRLSTIVKAGKVVVLEQGQIVEQGTYQELLEQGGRLWHYHNLQHKISKTK